MGWRDIFGGLMAQHRPETQTDSDIEGVKEMAGGFKGPDELSGDKDWFNKKLASGIASIKAKQAAKTSFEETLIAAEYRFIRQYFATGPGEAQDPEQKLQAEGERMAQFVSELEAFLQDDRYPMVMSALRRLML